MEPLKQKQEKTTEKVRALTAVNEKIHALEKRFMDNEIKSSSYNRLFKQYKEENMELEMALNSRIKAKKGDGEEVIERVLPWMSNLFSI